MDKYKPGESINFMNDEKRIHEFHPVKESMNPEANSIFPGEGTRSIVFSILLSALYTFLVLSLSLSTSLYIYLFPSISLSPIYYL